MGVDRLAREAYAAAGLENGGENDLSLSGGPGGARRRVGHGMSAWCVPGCTPWHGRRAIPSRCCRRLAQAAGIAPFCAHELRHTYASIGVTLGLSLPIVGQLLGHTEWATTQRYAHLAANPVEQATELVGEAIRKALGG